MAEEGGEDDGEQRLAVVADQTHHVVIAPVVQGSFSHLGGRREEERESRRERGKEGAERERGGREDKDEEKRERGRRGRKREMWITSVVATLTIPV